MMTTVLRLIAVLLAITLTFAVEAGCELDQASLAFVPPATIRVLMTEQCGGVTCWRRYLETNGQRLGESRACEETHGDKGSPIRTTPTAVSP